MRGWPCAKQYPGTSNNAKPRRSGYNQAAHGKNTGSGGAGGWRCRCGGGAKGRRRPPAAVHARARRAAERAGCLRRGAGARGGCAGQRGGASRSRGGGGTAGEPGRERAPGGAGGGAAPGVAAGAHPLVAAQAALLLAHLEDERGDHAAASARRARLGFLTHAFAIGPFGEGRASFRTPFPPEAEPAPPALDHRYPGKGHEVGWRAADAVAREGALLLDGMLRPDDQAVAYVVAFVRSDADRRRRLRLGSPGPIEVWLNGRAGLRARRRPRGGAGSGRGRDPAGPRVEPHPHQDGGRRRRLAALRAAHRSGRWAVAVRAAWRRRHRRRRGGRGRLPAPAPQVAALDGLLARRAERARSAQALDGPRARARLAEPARPRVPGCVGRRATGGRARGPSFEAWVLAADVADTDDDRRRALESALDVAADGRARPGTSPAARALVLVRLAELARADRREARAAAQLAGALAVDPGCWPAVLTAADLDGDAGLPMAAVRRLETLPAGVRSLPRVLRLAARLYEAADRRAESDRALALLADDAPDRGRPAAPAGVAGARPRRRGGGAAAAGGGGGAAAGPAVAGDRPGPARRGSWPDGATRSPSCRRRRSDCPTIRRR